MERVVISEPELDMKIKASSRERNKRSDISVSDAVSKGSNLSPQRSMKIIVVEPTSKN